MGDERSPATRNPGVHCWAIEAVGRSHRALRADCAREVPAAL